MKVTSKAAQSSQNVAQQAAVESLGKSQKQKNRGNIERSELNPSAKVDVSNRALEMKRAKELATPSNDIDEAKVARIQKMIDDGDYKVSSEAVAERLLDEHLKMQD